MNIEKNWNKFSPNEIKDEIEQGAEEYFEEKNKKLEINDDLVIKERLNGHDYELKSAGKILEEVSGDDLYDWYAEAMGKRNREPLEKESFIGHFFEGNNLDQSISFGNKEKGYLLGYNKYGTFIPSHFAPKTMRGGYDLFTALGNSTEIPSVLAITEDLSETLSKMPCWHNLEIDKELLSVFRGELVKKEIMYNSHPAVKRLMMGLLLEYTNQE